MCSVRRLADCLDHVGRNSDEMRVAAYILCGNDSFGADDDPVFCPPGPKDINSKGVSKYSVSAAVGGNAMDQRNIRSQCTHESYLPTGDKRVINDGE